MRANGQQAKKRLALFYRIASALLLMPVVAVFVYLGGWAILAIGVLVTWLAVNEFVRLVRAAGYVPLHGLTLTAAVLLLLDAQFALVGWVLWGGTTPALPLLSLLILASLAWLVLRRPQAREAFASWAFVFAGAAYIGWLLRYYLLLRHLDADLPSVAFLSTGLTFERGALWLAIVMGATWICDTTAFFVGSAWGRRKLIPRVSPSKTWEGTIGGIGGAIIWCTLAGGYMGMSPLAGVTLGAAIGVAAVLGDLAESLLKRAAAAKDASSLIPGHGGILDRLDSMLFTGVVGYYCLLLLGAAHP
ncbi:MAG: phosphatidate cytidylyltransferase [Chloroflexota bacterium]